MLPASICLGPEIVIAVPILAVALAGAVGLIVRRVYLPKPSAAPLRTPRATPRTPSQEPLIKEGEPKPAGYTDGYDVLKATNSFLATVAPPTPQNADYVVDVENLTQEIHDKEKQIERLSAEKEEFSVFLIRDLLASQKLTEELKREVDFLKRKLSESEAKVADAPPKPRAAMESEEILKLQQNVQELNAKIKNLEQQLRRSSSPTSELTKSHSKLPHFKSPDLVREGSRLAGMGIPILEIIAEENAIETKKRELEITKEFSNRETVSPRESSVLKWRMEKGNKLDAFDKDGYLLIHRAVLEDRWDVVKHLMQIGADLNSFDSRGETALHLAVRNGNELMVDYLLVYEADPHATGDRDKSTPLHLCAYHGFIKCAAALVKAGADVEAKTEEGYTPLRVAVEREQVDFAIWLTEKHGANINCVDDLGESILTYAVRINRPSLIDFLLENGAVVDMVDGRNLSASMVAARADNSEIIRLLVSRGAPVDATNSDGKTALHFAASSGSAAAAETLLELGATVDAKDDLGNTPLHESCRHSKFSVSARLVAWKADLCVRGADELSPLALALCCNDNDTVTLLLSNGAN